MKKLLFAAVALFTIGSASSSFAGGCGTSYATVQHHYQPQTHYVVQEPCHQKVIIKQPCHTTYVKPCVQTYRVETPVYHNYNYGCNDTPAYNNHYTPSHGGH